MNVYTNLALNYCNNFVTNRLLPGQGVQLGQHLQQMNYELGQHLQQNSVGKLGSMSQLQVRKEVITCMLGGDVSLHLWLLHGNKITGCAANRKHPLFFIHMKRHMTDKLDIHLGFKSTHMTTGGRRELEKLRKSIDRFSLGDRHMPCLFIQPDKLLVLQTLSSPCCWNGTGVFFCPLNCFWTDSSAKLIKGRHKATIPNTP